MFWSLKEEEKCEIEKKELLLLWLSDNSHHFIFREGEEEERNMDGSLVCVEKAFSEAKKKP